MSIPLLSTGGLFTRLGVMGKTYNDAVTAYGSALNTNVENIRAQFASGNEGIVTDGIYTARNSYRTVHSSWQSYLQSLMQSTVVEMANDDSALASKTLASALAAVIKQMKSTSDSILRGSSSATVTAYSGNKGDAKILTSFTNPYGDAIATAYPETITLSCASDSSNYAESFSIAGQPTKSVTDYTWPGGSGASGSITLCNAASDNIIKNANFSTWSSPSAMPDSWTTTTGSAGSTIVRDTSVKRTAAGGYSLQFVSDGSTLLNVKQQLQASTIAVNNVLCLHFWGKMSAADASGILRCRLVDGSGSVINNDAGTANSFTKDMNTTIGTSYTSLSGFFQLPRQLPSTGVFLEIGMSVSPASAKTLNISLIGLSKAQPFYVDRKSVV